MAISVFGNGSSAGVSWHAHHVCPAAGCSQQHVAGVEVWVQAQEQQGVVTDIPTTAVAICCGGELVSSSTASIISCLQESSDTKDVAAVAEQQQIAEHQAA
jgi:hypothetical protein